MLWDFKLCRFWTLVVWLWFCGSLTLKLYFLYQSCLAYCDPPIVKPVKILLLETKFSIFNKRWSNFDEIFAKIGPFRWLKLKSMKTYQTGKKSDFNAVKVEVGRWSKRAKLCPRSNWMSPNSFKYQTLMHWVSTKFVSCYIKFKILTLSYKSYRVY